MLRLDFVDHFARRDQIPFDALFRVVRDPAQTLLVAHSCQRQGETCLAGAARSADSVNVIFFVVRNIVIKYDIHIVDVDSPGSDIRRDENLQVSVLEAL